MVRKPTDLSVSTTPLSRSSSFTSVPPSASVPQRQRPASSPSSSSSSTSSFSVSSDLSLSSSDSSVFSLKMLPSPGVFIRSFPRSCVDILRKRVRLKRSITAPLGVILFFPLAVFLLLLLFANHSTNAKVRQLFPSKKLPELRWVKTLLSHSMYDRSMLTIYEQSNEHIYRCTICYGLR